MVVAVQLVSSKRLALRKIGQLPIVDVHCAGKVVPIGCGNKPTKSSD